MGPLEVFVFFLSAVGTWLLLGAMFFLVRRMTNTGKMTVKRGDSLILGDIAFTVLHVDHRSRTITLENDAPEVDDKEIHDEMSIDELIRLSQEDDYEF